MESTVAGKGFFCVLSSKNDDSGGKLWNSVVQNGGIKWEKGLSPI